MSGPMLYTSRDYPCGCSASGAGDIPPYCSVHGKPPQVAGNMVLHDPQDGSPKTVDITGLTIEELSRIFGGLMAKESSEALWRRLTDNFKVLWRECVR